MFCLTRGNVTNLPFLFSLLSKYDHDQPGATLCRLTTNPQRTPKAFASRLAGSRGSSLLMKLHPQAAAPPAHPSHKRTAARGVDPKLQSDQSASDQSKPTQHSLSSSIAFARESMPGRFQIGNIDAPHALIPGQSINAPHFSAP
jgi:hypothetical protein